MENQTNKPERVEPSTTDQSRCLVYSRVEIAAILATLHKAGTLFTAYFGSGNDFILTSLVAVRPEADELIVDFGADAATNQRALQSRQMAFVAVHERIQIRFSVDAVRKTHFEGRDAFSMNLPAQLLRLQRRESFRVSLPLTRPLKCMIGPPAHTSAEVTVIDISCGGVAIIASSDPLGIEPGTRFQGCRILLPDSGEVRTDILVKNTYEITLKNGTRQLRAGCEFVAISGRDQALIQRYINKIERERKGLVRGG